jgi:hypothetical protein
MARPRIRGSALVIAAVVALLWAIWWLCWPLLSQWDGRTVIAIVVVAAAALWVIWWLWWRLPRRRGDFLSVSSTENPGVPAVLPGAGPRSGPFLRLPPI